MLILDKTNDITILKTLGCSRKDIKLIFFQKSILSIVFSISVGMFLGLLIAFLQQKFGFIQLGEDNFIINHYPIKFIAKDILFSVLSVFLIGIVATVFSIQVLTNRLFKNKI